jgi:hypothetical protein
LMKAFPSPSSPCFHIVPVSTVKVVTYIDREG